MIAEYQLRLLPADAFSEQSIIAFVAQEKGLDARTVTHVRVLRRSIDARQRVIYVNLKVRVYVNEQPADEEYTPTFYPNVADKPQVLVIGAGPGGLFASLKLIELGFKPILIERGKDVHERRKDVASISKSQWVDPESNYCFGEGGAGAYSDGKLYTRSKKRGSVEKVLNVFCQHGASTSILADAHPHIGTDKLPGVIENMRKTILNCGGEVHFQTRMTSLIMSENRVVGVEAKHLPDGKERAFQGPVILATGHSARDVYHYLYASGVEMEPKGIAVGVRLEHPSALIDRIQYHNKNGRGAYLPAAEYSFVTQVDGRGVYSFCMCPGGVVIPSATNNGQVVVNGMSASGRNGRWSNAGMVVEIRPEDILSSAAEPLNELTVMQFQEQLEAMCWQQGNRRQTAPAQRMADFVNNRLSYDLPSSSYPAGIISSPLHFWLPEQVSMRLKEGFKTFGKQAHGFLTNEAIIIGVETRTSSPIRIIRDRERLQHIRVKGLFPCGEGAGYAGGIVSSGIDGERCAEMCAAYLNAI